MINNDSFYRTGTFDPRFAGTSLGSGRVFFLRKTLK